MWISYKTNGWEDKNINIEKATSIKAFGNEVLIYGRRSARDN